jgi:hypothetical protein
MKKAIFGIFIILILLHFEVQAQRYSILTGIVTELHGRGLTVKSAEGRIIQLRVGRRTVYLNRIPVVGDKVKVEYSIVRGVHIGYSITILEDKNLEITKKEMELQKKVVEKPPPLPPSPPPVISAFAGKWEGFWNDKKDYVFTLTITEVNLELEVAEVNYESKDLQFFKKANIIPGEKPKIEWVINSIVKPEGPFASPVTIGSKDYFAILSESIPIYFTFEIQKDGNLKGTFDSHRSTAWGTSGMAVMKRVK